MINRYHNTLIMNFNCPGGALTFGLLGMSLRLSTDVPLATKGYRGMGILLLTLSLINVVKYRFDMRFGHDRLHKIEDARNEKLPEDALKDGV